MTAKNTTAAGRLDLVLDADKLAALERELGERLTAEEAALPKPAGEATLFAHSLRVARMAQRLAEATPGASREAAYLAGLLHDAGKLARLQQTCSDVREEVRSAEAARELIGRCGLDAGLAREVAAAIHELYLEEVTPSLSTRLVSDADNLDKLGLGGVAVFFVKQGLRGIGLGPRLLSEVGVELTYALHAERAMWTDAGRELAAERALESFRFFRAFVRSVRADGVYRFRVRKLVYEQTELYVVAQERCACGGTIGFEVSSAAGNKCTLLKVRQSCRRCDWQLTTEMCRPRVAATAATALPPDSSLRGGDGECE